MQTGDATRQFTHDVQTFVSISARTQFMRARLEHSISQFTYEVTHVLTERNELSPSGANCAHPHLVCGGVGQRKGVTHSTECGAAVGDD